MFSSLSSTIRIFFFISFRQGRRGPHARAERTKTMRHKLTKRKFALNLTRLLLRKRLLSSKSPAHARREGAEATAVAALGFLAAEPERLSRFVALSGLEIANLRRAAQDE